MKDSFSSSSMNIYNRTSPLLPILVSPNTLIISLRILTFYLEAKKLLITAGSLAKNKKDLTEHYTINI